MINLDAKEYADAIGLIVLDAEGISYQRQTGGIYIDTPQALGVFVEFGIIAEDTYLDGAKLLLSEMFGFKSKYGGRSDKIDEDTAKKIDFIMNETLNNSVFHTDFLKPFGSEIDTIKTDRNAFNKSQEAWVYVVIKARNGKEFPAILTWENSD